MGNTHNAVDQSQRALYTSSRDDAKGVQLKNESHQEAI